MYFLELYSISREINVVDQIQVLNEHYYKKSNVFGICIPKYHCAKIVRTRSFSGLTFPTFGLNTKIYRLNLCIQSECGNIRTRKMPNTEHFLHSVSTEYENKRPYDHMN